MKDYAAFGRSVPRYEKLCPVQRGYAAIGRSMRRSTEVCGVLIFGQNNDYR